MHYLGLRSTDDHAHDIKPVNVPWPVEAANPTTSRFGHLALLTPVNSAERTYPGGVTSYHNVAVTGFTVADARLVTPRL